MARYFRTESFALRVLARMVLVLGCMLPQTSAAQAPSDFAALADAARDANRLQEAIPLYRKALAKRPDWKEGWWSLGTILYDADSYKEAAPAFRRLAAIDPKNGTAHLMLGLCEYQLGLYGGSMKHIQAAKQFGIRKDEGLEHVLLYHEGMLWLQQGEYENAIEPLGKLVKQDVRSEELSVALGMAVLLIPPKEVPPDGSSARRVVVRAGRAEEYSLAKKHEDGTKAYSELVQEFPDFPNVHYAYGRYLLSVDEVEAGQAQFAEEIKRNPSHIRARMQIAATYYRTDSATGIPYAREVVKLKPEYPFGHYLLGLLYFDSGDVANSIPELETAARMVPKESQFQFVLGNAYARAGRKAEAAQARAAFRRLGGDTQSSGGSSTYGEQPPFKLGQVPGHPEPPATEKPQ